MQRLDSPLPFLEAIEGLKDLKRAGWVERGVPEPESVSDHMYRMVWFCLTHPELKNEEEKEAILMCLIHDIGETTAGDITPASGIDAETKHKREKLGVQYLSLLLKRSNPYWASRMIQIWDDYESGETRVAKLVHQVDKLECLHQAFIYFKRYKENHNLEETLTSFKSLRGKISDTWLSQQADDILKEWELHVKKDKQRLPSIVFVIGGPGVGKGTLCTRIAEKFNFAHLSVGELLREEQNDPASDFGDFLRESIQQSVIVPPYLTIMMLKDKVQSIQSQNKGVLIDGFPRSIEQAVAFEQEISGKYSTIYLDCTPEAMTERIRGRSGSSQRDDDNLVTLQKRLATFSRTNDAVVDHISKNTIRTVCYPIR
ncbi:P-loop containing nucleoside triphosphate hydrolase protein [Colletotrichum caudatum]|nr:P-loop containing nucleoside triphosphate hydrolase protein [Colletotrichum caudatum]